MPLITLMTEIAAPPEVVFDLSRSIDLHLRSTARTNEKVVAGRASGLIDLGETVTWEATHFFVRQRLTVRITQMTRPTYFRDSMIAGVFSRFDHDHIFKPTAAGTEMIDRMDFESPLGVLGHIANRLLVTGHLRRLLEERNRMIKAVAEGSDSGR